jgi:hypothetical protein
MIDIIVVQQAQVRGSKDLPCIPNCTSGFIGRHGPEYFAGHCKIRWLAYGGK